MARTTSELRERRHRASAGRLAGTAERPRVAVSRSNKHISAQIIDDDAGRTLAAASSVEAGLRGSAGGNVEGARAGGAGCSPSARRPRTSPPWSSTAAASTTTAAWPPSPTRCATGGLEF